MARSLLSDPPGGLVKVKPSKRPLRSSVVTLVAPLTGFWWHSAQAWAL